MGWLGTFGAGSLLSFSVFSGRRCDQPARPGRAPTTAATVARLPQALIFSRPTGVSVANSAAACHQHHFGLVGARPALRVISRPCLAEPRIRYTSLSCAVQK